jgi:hypothetical protein
MDRSLVFSFFFWDATDKPTSEQDHEDYHDTRAYE